MKKRLVMMLGAALSMNAFAVEYLYEANDDGVNTITLTAMTRRTEVSRLNIPSVYDGKTVTRIGEGFASEDWMISYVSLPDSVREVGKDAFSSCSGLTDLDLGTGLEVVRKGAFSDCGLASLALPSTVFIVEEKAFTKCPIETISAAGRSVYVQGGVLYCSGAPWNDDLIAVVSCVGVTDVNLASGCTEIGAHAFCHGDWASALRSIVFSAALEKVGHDAFSGCGKLEKADFTGTKLKKIREDAFRKCSSLRWVKFPATLKEIYGHCFENCTALEDVVFYGDAPLVVPNDDPYEEMLDQIYVLQEKPSGIPVWSHLKTPVTSVAEGVKGWNLASGTWQGRPIQLVQEDPVVPDFGPFGPFVPGVAVSLAIPELIGYSPKGLPSGLRFNKRTGAFTGTPRRATAAGGAFVTFKKRGEKTVSAVFVVGPVPVVSVALAGDVEKCKVSGGNKAYLAGKKVTVRARAAKGAVFTGWTMDGEPWPNAETYLKPTQKFVMPAEDVSLCAGFVKEKMTIETAVFESVAFRVGTEVLPGAVPIEVGTMSGLKSLRAKSLPRGLKLSKNRKTGVWSVCGKPRASGAFSVVLKATAKSGAVEEKTVAISVAE